MTEPIPVFDGHNDVLLRLLKSHAASAETAFIEGTATGHLDLPRARQGGFVGGMFAIFPPSPHSSGSIDRMQGGAYAVPLPPELGLAEAQASTTAMASILLRLERAGGLSVCRSVAEIRAAIAQDLLAAVFHIEGCEAVDTDFRMLDLLCAAGLRSLGIVWSRPNAFGHGVPFTFPSTPDTGPGLTDAGRDLVRLCNERRILIDLSHLNEKGFWDVAELSTAPLVATHSNAHSVCPHARNLTDRQLDAIRESGGMVGLNFATAFLRPDGSMNADTDLEVMVRHVDALIERLGEDGVGMGSDYDGATVPAAIKDAAGLPRLFEALRAHGYDDALLRKLGTENWFGVLERTWGG
ncbi:dipeptidase [Inquilinus sp. Marseille-Q2685]|uniref:dipeptidase n=1 Tax=Inquilinus sp. Marseille-Q2685 TaxID=2866581 RepID=UPI001CE45966|nr:dipeptidase [Inquilinus sp. Marseille-Q2685]